jgi:hypothetical protein
MKNLLPGICTWLCCFPALWLGAQSQSCSDWAIQISSTPLPVGENDTLSVCSADQCATVYFYVYLTRTASQNMNGSGDYNTVTFNSFFIEGSLLVNSGVGLQFASNVNVAKSVACTPTLLNNPGDPNAPLLGYDPASQKFVYTINAPTTWNMAGRRLLFTLAVDAAVGQTVKPNITASAIGFPGGPYCDPLSLQNLSLGKSMVPPPSGCTIAGTDSLAIRFGNSTAAPIPGYPHRKIVPIWVSGPDSAVFEMQQIDFLFYSKASNGQHIPKIIGNILPSGSVTLSYLPLTEQYAAYTRAEGTFTVKTTGSTSPNAENTLFYLAYDGPVLASECLDIDLKFWPNTARINGDTYTCCQPSLGDSETVKWDLPDCATSQCSEVALYAQITYQGPVYNCKNTLVIDLTISADQNTSLDKVACRLELKKSGPFLLYNINLLNVYCLNLNDCVTVTDVSPDLAIIDINFTQFMFGYNAPAPLLIGPDFSSGQSRRLVSIPLNIQGGGCIEGITFRDAKVKKTNAGEYCLCSHSSGTVTADTTDDICTESLTIECTLPVALGDSSEICPISNWRYFVNQSLSQGNFPFGINCTNEGSGGLSGYDTTSVCTCTFKNQAQQIALYKNDNPLNGVSVADLLLTSKHILGIEPFDNGFKTLAADANQSGSVTNFDILETRKLILGIYSTFPFTRSWRFIAKDIKSQVEDAVVDGLPTPFQLINPSGHTSTVFSGSGYVTLQGRRSYSIPFPNCYVDKETEAFMSPASTLDDVVEFVGYKVGDVNFSAIPTPDCPAMLTHTDDRSASAITLGIHRQEMKKGATLEIPVFWTETGGWSAWQLALGYDPELFEFLDLRWPDSLPLRAMRDRAWHQPQAGELRVLCYDAEKIMPVQAGNVAFYVKVKVKKTIADAAVPLFIRNSVMPSEIYDAAGAIFRPRIEASDLPLREPVATALKTWAFDVYPNPSATQFRLNIDAPQTCEVTLLITDVLGNTAHRQVLSLREGANILNSQQLPPLKAGQYFCTLFTPEGVQSVRLIRQEN